MSISAVALFGSRARGDAAPDSDVDVLLISSERKTRHATMGNISLYLYPWAQLLRKAASGDLFVCHIVREARPLHDPEDRLGALKRAFRFKDSYVDEIRQASDLAWYIARNFQELPGAVATKRIAWCVRTILIARTAEQHRPLFAANELMRFSGSADVRQLIAQKDDREPSPGSIALLGDFLQQYGEADPVPDGNASAYRFVFKTRKNKVALQTSRARDVAYADFR